jgi:NTP pyrophosphatase (non-canonical NTP hydrolase)
MIDIDDLASSLHSTAKEKGFWDDNNGIIFYLKQLMMVTTEVAEVAEAMRKSQGDRAVVRELADIIIRTLDLYAGLVEDGYTKESLQENLLDKAQYNSQRPNMHGLLA